MIRIDQAGTSRLFVDGVFVESASDAVIDVINPATGLSCHSISTGCDLDVDRAVGSARVAYDDGRWSGAPPSFRKKTLYRLADLIADASAELDALDAVEMGKPVSETFGNALAAASLTRFYGESIDKIVGDVYPSERGSYVSQRRVPRGVVAAVVPWNFPTYVAALKLAPALAAGNCVIVKPSEQATRSTCRLAELALEAGVPPGVLNVTPGLGATVGKALGLHPDIDVLTFTGSTGVGKLMLQYAGQSNMKAVIAECGGKSPQIVFGDGVDLDVIAEAIVKSFLTNQGQVCSMGSRVLVERSVEAALVEKIASRFDRVVIGDPLDPSTNFGPVASAKQFSQVMNYVASAKIDGAQQVIGGTRVLKESGGYFIQPTLFRQVPPDARIAQEEIFGPVLSVTTFDSEEEAIRIANGTIYGLTAYVWTADLSRGMRMANGIRSAIRINAAAPSGEGPGRAYSYEPTGQSGQGAEGGLAGIEVYLRRQLIWINYA